MNQPSDAFVWKSKIVGHDRVPPGELTANPFNHRTHPPAQRDVVQASIREIGFVRSVTVNRTTGHIVDGHERVCQALQTGQPWIDVEYVELSEEDERKALAVLDRSAALAAIDPDALDELLKSTEFDEAVLQKLAAELAAEAEICLDPAGLSAEPELGGSTYSILVECVHEQQQVELLQRFEREGLACRAWIS